VLPQCAPAGDQSPHLLWNKKAEQRMLELRGHDMRHEIGRRVANAVDEVLPVVRKEILTTLPFRHIVREISLPRRLITEDEALEVRQDLAKLEVEEKAAQVKNKLFAAIGRCKNALERYELQKEKPECKMEMHVLRLGDLAFTTSVYELFLDYAVRIKARSPAAQTFLVQLAGKGENCYLPTEKAVAGKGYGGGVYDNLVGPEGGQVLVEETVKALNELWNNRKK